MTKLLPLFLAAASVLAQPATYKGREIAETMSYHGAPWLIRETREQEEHPKKLLQALGLKPGQTVADIGCGNGFYTLRMAQIVGPTGKALAVDIQPEMLELLRERARAAGISNVEPILGAPGEPKLPEAAVDLILLVDVYHEFSFPERMLQAMGAALAPGGRIAIAEYRMEDPDVPIKLLHKMTEKQVVLEFKANGFTLAESYDELPWQHLLFFERSGER